MMLACIFSRPTPNCYPAKANCVRMVASAFRGAATGAAPTPRFFQTSFAIGPRRVEEKHETS